MKKANIMSDWSSNEKFFRRPNGDQTDHRMGSQVENPAHEKENKGKFRATIITIVSGQEMGVANNNSTIATNRG